MEVGEIQNREDFLNLHLEGLELGRYVPEDATQRATALTILSQKKRIHQGSVKHRKSILNRRMFEKVRRLVQR